MDCVNFSTLPPQETQGHTSKGNQLKWRYNDFWYKADYMGYEGAAETIVSQALKKSTVHVPFVQYELAQMRYHGNVYCGCRSRNFLPEGTHLLPLEKLYRQYTGKSLALDLVNYVGVEAKIQYVVEQTERYMGLSGFGAYLTAMLEVDAFFLNEDRHTNNIAVLYTPETNQYDFCPLFDHGLALLADTTLDFPFDKDIDQCLQQIEAKPFSTSFDVQLDAAEALYGIQLHFLLKSNDIPLLVAPLHEFYDNQVCNRIEALLRRQMRHYAYLVQ